MPWNTIATIALTQTWQVTPLIADELGLIRLSFSSAGIPVEIAQIEPDTGDIHDRRRILASGQAQIFEFECPAVWESRAIAVRLPLSASPFDVTIELSSVPIAEAGGIVNVDLQPVLSGQSQILSAIESIDIDVPPVDLQLVLSGQSQILSAIESIDIDVPPVDLQPVLSGQSQILSAIESIDIDVPPVDLQPVLNGQSQILTKLDQALAPRNSLDYYAYLGLFSPFVIAPLNDPGVAALNLQGVTIGNYGGTYLRDQLNLIPRVPESRSTLFNSGGIWFTQLVSSPNVFTLVVRFRATPTATGSFFSHVGSTEFGSSGGNNRELYFLPDGRIAFRVWNNTESRLITTASYRDSVTRTMVLRFNTNVASLFMDGVKVAESTLLTPATINGYWRLGHTIPSIAGFANGITMQGCAILNAALTDTQIAAIQNFV